MEIKYGNTIIKLYDNINDLPIVRYNKMQQEALQAAGIGGTLDNVRNKLGNCIDFIEAGKTDEAREEINNILYAVWVNITGLDAKSRTFAMLVHKINNKTFPIALTENDISEILKALEPVPVKETEAALEALKKNLMPN